jgi:hypothetical protein
MDKAVKESGGAASDIFDGAADDAYFGTHGYLQVKNVRNREKP